jgi:heme exporter protein B
MSALRAVGAVFARAAREGWAGGTGLFLPLGFFLGAVVMVPLVLGADAQARATFAPGFCLIFLALSALVTLERLFQADVEDGSLDQLRLSPLPLEAVAALKVLALWSVAALPILLCLPVAGLFLGVGPLALVSGLPAFAMASLSVYAWGGVGAALSAGIRRSGLLVALIVFPLSAPALIFAASAITPQSAGASAGSGAFLFLCAATLMAFALAPLAMAQGLRGAADG